MVLERLRQGWEQNKLRAWLQKEMPANPQWKVLISNELWLCPICLEAGAQFRKADDLFEAAAIHLGQMCEKFKEGQREPVLPLEKLVATARYLCAEEKLQDDPAWQQKTRSGLWFCPYCLRETPGKFAANGTADRGTLEGIARHLTTCQAYQGGHGVAKSAAEVRAASQRANLQGETIELARKKLGNDPVWQIHSTLDRWVCPYCRHIIGKIEFRQGVFVPESLIIGVAQHLVQECDPYKNRFPEATNAKELEEAAMAEELLGDPRQIGFDSTNATQKTPIPTGPNLATMDPKQRLLYMKDQVVKERAWQQRTSEGAWFCPYCARETDVEFPLDGRINMSVVERIFKHVENCHVFDHGRGRVKPLEAIAAALKEQESATKAAVQVLQKMNESPVWRVKDPDGRWVCPYCRKVMATINISTEMQLQRGAPGQIAKHLIEHCAAYKAKTQPAASVAELEAVFKKPPTPEPQAQRVERTPIPEELLRSINEEMASSRAKNNLSDDMKKSLEEAKKRQLQMLPEAPTIDGLDFGVVFRPCAHVAGDFYDFVRVGPDELGILMGDVSGHGIEAGMVMALVRKVISMNARGRSSPREALVISNPEIYPDIDRRTFITGFYGVFHQQTKAFKFVRAGHNPLLVFNPARTPTLQSFEPKGMALGMDRGPRFESTLEEQTIQLQSGDLVFLYTDGLSEAADGSGDELGVTRIGDWLQKYGKYDVDYLLHKVSSELLKFHGSEEMEDDVTMIGFKIQ